MFGFISSLIGGALTPLIDQVTDMSARLLRKLALFVLAALCLNVVLIALTLAFGMWIATMAGAIGGVLAVAALYATIAGVAIFFALRKPKASAQGEPAAQTAAKAQERADLDGQVDKFVAPILGFLQSVGLRKEQLAVLAGASLAKRLGPMPLVGLAVVAGFLIGRSYKSWKIAVSLDAITGLLAATGLFGFGTADDDDPSDNKKTA